jgi:glycosyltransferase involved in cell wall biosynthesis
MNTVSVIVPAYNEAERLPSTLKSIRSWLRDGELIVVDDGSQDATAELAKPYATHVIRHERNGGKGASLTTGWLHSTGDIVMFLDADLGHSAQFADRLLHPLTRMEADMTIACLPPARTPGGFGLVLGLARYGILQLCGYRARAPLSGQRAIRRKVLNTVKELSDGFGIEVGLTIDAVRRGYRVAEIEVPFSHRETGRDWHGFLHRGKEFMWVSRTLWQKWRAPESWGR